MRTRPIAAAVVALLALSTTALSAPNGGRGHTTSSRRGKSIPSIKNLAYKPTPALKAIPPQPDLEAVPKPDPKGTYNAYDIDAYETFWFPQRQPGDKSAKDAPGGTVTHGTCPEGGCDNHALEYKKYWMKRMKTLVKPFGGAVHSYDFFSPGTETQAPPGTYLRQPAGDTFNLIATVPGSIHPEQSVIVSAHWDQTDSGPGSAWDSAEGHATVFRIAKLMIDYWKKTGTRPPISVKFAAWGAEEAGSYGSQAFVRDNLFPFPSQRVRAYFNLDPCAGAYPAFYRGNPADRVAMVMQLSDPNDAIAPAVIKSIKSFNKEARKVLGDVMNHLDDKLTDVPGEPEIFISDEEAKKKGVASQEDEIVTALGGLAFFSSDYRRFEAIGVPILNLFPDMFGPHADRNYTGYRSDGISTLHTPNDNFKTLNALTGVDQTGLTPSQGWYKGLEFCAHMNAWFMLQPDMGGAVKRTKAPTAYFEATAPSPAPVQTGTAVKFDARGSSAFQNTRTLKRVPFKKLKFKWDLGDGTKATGRKLSHKYKKDGVYTATLKVTKRGSGASDTMKMLVKIGS